MFQGIDFTTVYKKVYSFNMLLPENCKQALDVIKEIKSRNNELNIDIILNPIDTFKKRGYLEEWKEMS